MKQLGGESCHFPCRWETLDVPWPFIPKIFCVLLQLEQELKKVFLVPEINQTNSGQTGGAEDGIGIEQNRRESQR